MPVLIIAKDRGVYGEHLAPGNKLISGRRSSRVMFELFTWEKETLIYKSPLPGGSSLVGFKLVLVHNKSLSFQYSLSVG